MFKCFDSVSQAPVVLLDIEWGSERLDGLRARGRDGILLCPQCKQPVRVRAGTRKAWHFAHHTLGACALQSESAALLQARAQLYQWLKACLNGSGATVAVEENVSELLPRPVDCLVTYPDGKKIAFWLNDKGMRNRDAFRSCFTDVKVNVIFLSGMLRPMRNPDGGIPDSSLYDLSPSEREFLYGSLLDRSYGSIGKSIHYLDPETSLVTTLRGTRLEHAPGIHRTASILRDSLFELRLVRNRLMIHPREAGLVAKAEEDQRLQEERKRQDKLRIEQEAAQREAARQQELALWTSRNLREAPVQPEKPISKSTPPQLLITSMNQNLICTDCGNKTTAWVNAKPDKGTCLCRNCYEVQENERLRTLRET